MPARCKSNIYTLIGSILSLSTPYFFIKSFIGFFCSPCLACATAEPRQKRCIWRSSQSSRAGFPGFPQAETVGAQGDEIIGHPGRQVGPGVSFTQSLALTNTPVFAF
jgi:hypothetical protein